jgi:hypothetical protein
MKFFLARLPGLEGRERTKWKAHRRCAASERPGPESRNRMLRLGGQVQEGPFGSSVFGKIA